MKLQVRGAETFVTTGGRPFVPEQPTIVFVHGAGMNRIVWYLQTRYFAHHGHTVLAVDLPGHGRSQGTLLRRRGFKNASASGFAEGRQCGRSFGL